MTKKCLWCPKEVKKGRECSSCSKAAERNGRQRDRRPIRIGKSEGGKAGRAKQLAELIQAQRKIGEPPSCPVCGAHVRPPRLVNCSRACTIRAADMRRNGKPIDSPWRRVELQRRA